MSTEELKTLVVSNTEKISPGSNSDDYQLPGLPTHLKHKPIIACDYQQLISSRGLSNVFDPRYISVGRAQWDPDDLSVKIFRRCYDVERWSPQSEEIPVDRLPFMMAMLLSAIAMVQNPSQGLPNELNEKVVEPRDIDFLREGIRDCADGLKKGLTIVKDLLNQIDLEKI